MKIQKSDSLILTWENITAWTNHVGKSQSRKQILYEVNGIAKSGVLTAILSPSGAGKTTLLAVLSKRFKGQVHGKVMVNGCELREEEMSRISGYVCQKDQNYQDLTVYEHLFFMAQLKMRQSMSLEKRHQHVLQVTKDLILSHKMQVQISSLSGGQKKRLSLAVQLLTEPKILFCDEPTTGLDSYSAEQVVKLLRAIANNGKMVICSIHQPASGIFEIFDEVSLLASGGKLAFHGPVSSIRSFFSELGASCPKNFNLSEFIVSQVTIKNSCSHQNEDEKLKVEHVIDGFIQSEISKNLIIDIRNVMSERMDLQSLIKTSKREAASFVTQFKCLFWRIVLLSKKSYKVTLLNFLMNAIINYVIGLFYNASFGGDQKRTQNILGFLLMMTMQVAYATSYLVIEELPNDISICVLEIADRVYSPFSFYLSKSAFMTVSITLQNIIFMLLGYWASGLPETIVDYLMITIITVFLSTVACAFGIFLSTAFRSIETNSLFYTPYEFLNRLFCGVFLKIDSLPWFLAILKYTSYQYFSYEALNIIEWSKFDYLKCDTRTAIPCYQSGDEVLSSLGFRRENLPVDIVGLILSTVFWHLLAFAFFLHKLKLFATY